MENVPITCNAYLGLPNPILGGTAVSSHCYLLGADFSSYIKGAQISITCIGVYCLPIKGLCLIF